MLGINGLTIPENMVVVNTYLIAIRPCADPESFVRGGPILTTCFFFFFLIMREGRIQVPT